MQTTLSESRPHPSNRRPAFIDRRALWGLVFIVSVLWALGQAGLFRSEVVNLGGWSLVARFLEALIHPELSLSFLLLVLDATLTTLAYAIGGIFISTLLGLFGGILASETWWVSVYPRRVARGSGLGGKAPWLVIRSGLAIPRAIHEVIWGLFFINIIGLDPLSAILAIAIPFGAITAKVFSEILDETPSEPLFALLNSGVSPLRAFVYALLPRAFADLISYSFYRFECAIRSAAVLGLIGAGGLGYEIFLSLQTLKYDQIWTLLLALFLLNGLADLWSSALRSRIGLRNRCSGDCADSPTIRSTSTGTPITSDPLIKSSIRAAVILVPLAFIYIAPDFGKVFSTRSISNLVHVAQISWPPAFGALTIQDWIMNIGITVSMSLLAVAFAGLISPLLAFPAALTSKSLGGASGWRGLRSFLFLLARGFLLIARSIPAPIWALIFLFLFFPGILPGALALAYISHLKNRIER